MIGISTTTANTSGAMVIHERRTSSLKQYRPRVSRTATLDGGAVIVHGGFSHGDRTLNVQADMSRTQVDALIALVQTETLLNISLPDGFFSGSIDNISADAIPAQFSILLKEKLNA